MACEGLVGAVIYSDWLFLGPLIGRNLSPESFYVSEMGALSHPHHVYVNTLDIISGLCIFFLALCLMYRVSELGARKVVSFGCVGLMLFGLTTALGALVPMTCIPSVQPRCTAGGLALNGPVRELIYTA